MKALFLLKHPGAVRNLESTVRLLADRGHDVVLAFESTKTSESVAFVQQLAAEKEGVSVIEAPALRPRARYAALAYALRVSIDYLRYLEPRYANAAALRGRAAMGAPKGLKLLARLPLVRSERGLRALRGLLQTVERGLPPRGEIADFVRAQAPDVLLVVPLIGIGSGQADYVRAARRLGIRTTFPVLSWDNLTNKGLLRDTPDLTIVWNDAQAAEAVELHDVPDGRIVRSGAAAYDHWFDWRPSREREEFCREVGLRPDRPYVLYVCSSPFIAPDETGFVERWVETVRRAGGPLAEVGVLVRPHPQNAAQWHDYEPAEQVAVWPRGGEDPMEEAARRNYFDSLHHCAAVLGVNTSALIESAIVDRPVLTILDPEFAGTQEGTLHFHHLSQQESGPLFVARSLTEHPEQLLAALAGHLDSSARNERFVGSFVRPNGVEHPAAPFAVDALEALAAADPPARPRSFLAPVFRLALVPLDAVLAAEERRRAAARRTRKRAEQPDTHARATEAIGAATAGTGRVLAGPWLAEVGYELLYWIPFLRWATREDPGLADRLVAVSRGGVASWYAGICRGGYVELLDHVSPDHMRRLVAEDEERGGLRKQMTVSEVDRRLLAQVSGDLDGKTSASIHPSIMFDAHRTSHKQRTLSRSGGLFPLERLEPPVVRGLDARLPDEFVAVRFYFSACFPDGEQNREIVRQVVDTVLAATSVVVLDPGVSIDDHSDAELVGRELIRLDDLLTPATNLAVQTAAIARARAFVGTYGGLSYLAPLLGVTSVALYAQPERFRPHHLERAQAAFRAPEFGAFSAIDVRSPDALEAVLAALDMHALARVNAETP